MFLLLGIKNPLVVPSTHGEIPDLRLDGGLVVLDWLETRLLGAVHVVIPDVDSSPAQVDSGKPFEILGSKHVLHRAPHFVVDEAVTAREQHEHVVAE